VDTLTINQLKDRTIDELLVHSLCSSLYGVTVVIGERYYKIKQGFKMYHSYSVDRIQQDLSASTIKKLTLVQDSPYDEMIGQVVKQVPNTLSLSKSNPKAQHNAAAGEAVPARLPCRGCTTNCTNYAQCDGKPWR
jgi:CDP-diacylglycerol pyrophosphatase